MLTFFRTHLFVVLCLVCGAVAGLGLYTFSYAQGFSYFSHDPKACANCHVMNDYYDSWTKSSHHNAGGCIECHMPEGNFAKLVAKSDNGYRHSKGFTFMDFHEPIQITPRNIEILQENCVRCHNQLTHGIAGDLGKANQMTCIHCHSHVGHR